MVDVIRSTESVGRRTFPSLVASACGITAVSIVEEIGLRAVVTMAGSFGTVLEDTTAPLGCCDSWDD